MSATASQQDSTLAYRGQCVVRIIGGVLLTTCAAMLVLGLTILSDRLRGPQFVLYWSWCFLLATAAIIVGITDMILLRRASKRTRRELFRREFMSGEFVEKARTRLSEPDES